MKKVNLFIKTRVFICLFCLSSVSFAGAIEPLEESLQTATLLSLSEERDIIYKELLEIGKKAQAIVFLHDDVDDILDGSSAGRQEVAVLAYNYHQPVSCHIYNRSTKKIRDCSADTEDYVNAVYADSSINWKELLSNLKIHLAHHAEKYPIKIVGATAVVAGSSLLFLTPHTGVAYLLMGVGVALTGAIAVK